MVEESVDRGDVSARVGRVRANVLDAGKVTAWQLGPIARAIWRACWTGTTVSASPWIRSSGRLPHRRAERIGIRLSVLTPKATRAAIRMPGLNQLGRWLWRV